MAYVSLYRKYRPQTFAEVVGQDHVTRTLRHALADDRLHHAYLFTGPRGTGKTSTARILAKSINCEEGPTATPCNTCRQCVEITSGSSVDVIELDMASHGGVDDARELRERALFAPASARRKVYILDEVHMASTAAFNALLKLIEEPPSHVVFTMATTDPQKVLPTIMSRVQRLDLRRVAAVPLGAHLTDLVQREGREIEQRAVDAVVRAGDGSVRDSLSVLEQVLSYARGDVVTAAEVDDVLGTTDVSDTAGLVDAVAAGDLAGSLGIVQSLLDGGRDLRRFAFDLLQHLRDLLVLQVAPTRPDLVDATDERREVLDRQALAVPAPLLVEAVDLLANAVTEMRLGPPRLPLELVLAKLTVGRGASPLPHAVPIDADDGGEVDAREAAAARLPAEPAEDEPDDEPDGAAATADVSEPSEEPAPAPTADADEPEDADVGEPVESDADDDMAEPVESDDADGPSDDVDRALEVVDEPDPEPTLAVVADDEPELAVVDDVAEDSGEVEDPTVATADAAAEPEDETTLSESDLASRARALGEGGTAPPTRPDRPAGPEAVVEPPPPSESDQDLVKIQQRWDAVLEVLKDHGMRVKAIFEPARPVKLRNGVLTLRYSTRYGSFHAENATRGEFAEALTAAVQTTCDIRVKVDTLVEGNDAPPGRAPVSDAPTAPGDEHEAQVREAEARTEEVDPLEAQRVAAELLVSELGAEEIVD